MRTKKIKLSEKTNADLFALLLNLENNPYREWVHFRDEVDQVIARGTVPKEFHEVCDEIEKDRQSGATYAHLLRNCPIDEDRPVFDPAERVKDKYKKKKTFVGEGFLELFAQMIDSPPLAYDTRNNGDFYHDVYAQSKYSGTQTQKTDSELFFHNDRTAHEVRADYLALLAMRSHNDNRIYTGYIDGRAILEFLTEEQQKILRQPYFYTPFDDYSKDSNSNQVKSEAHSILENEHSFRYYDTRTKCFDDVPIGAKDALLALKDAIVKATKDQIHIKTGETFVFPNQDGLHNRELVEVELPEEAKIRWLLKTYNLRSSEQLNKYHSYFHDDILGLVKEPITTQIS